MPVLGGARARRLVAAFIAWRDARSVDKQGLGVLWSRPMLVVHVLQAILIGLAVGAALGVCTLLYYLWCALFGACGEECDDLTSSAPR